MHVGSREAPGGAGVHFALRSLHRTQAIAPLRGVSDRLRDFADGSGGIVGEGWVGSRQIQG
jgi:hypothetical protein